MKMNFDKKFAHKSDDKSVRIVAFQFKGVVLDSKLKGTYHH